MIKMKKNMKNKFTEKINDIKTSYLIFSLIAIVTVGFIIRFYYLPQGIPVIADGLDYFSYAHQMAQNGNFPKDWALSNNGWPSFLSIFFSIIDANTFTENILIQRILSISISVSTTLPLFFLCNRFFNKTLSLVGTALFIFEPRIILNSTLGLIEPLYILVLILILLFFLKNGNRTLYLSFLLAGIFAILRWEGLLLIFGMIVIFFTKNKHERKNILKLSIGIILFLIVVIPMSYINLENTGTDGLITPLLVYGPGYISSWMIEDSKCPDGQAMQPISIANSSDEEGMDCYPIDEYIESDNTKNTFLLLVQNGVENTTKFFGWALIPNFILFFPIAIIILIKNGLIKNWNSDKTIILAFGIILLLPAIYAYTRNFYDMRYLYIIFPIFSMISLVFINRFLDKNSKKQLFSLLIIIGIILISIIFVEQKLVNDYELEKERYEISKFIAKNTNGVNYSSFTQYLKAAELEIGWPKIPEPDVSGHVSSKIKKFSLNDYPTLIEFIKENKEKGLTHIITEDMPDREILLDVYNNPEKYPFLEKIYDGMENELVSKVRIFKINYDALV